MLDIIVRPFGMEPLLLPTRAKLRSSVSSLGFNVTSKQLRVYQTLRMQLTSTQLHIYCFFLEILHIFNYFI